MKKYLTIIIIAIVTSTLITIILKSIGAENSTIITGAITGGLMGPLSIAMFGKDK